tara:strand:- start:487 stop:645 length:159 start_codon:yes stop_codon:yes gene_type:complete
MASSLVAASMLVECSSFSFTVHIEREQAADPDDLGVVEFGLVVVGSGIDLSS